MHDPPHTNSELATEFTNCASARLAKMEAELEEFTRSACKAIKVLTSIEVTVEELRCGYACRHRADSQKGK